ncbi:MAG: hypothetical protein M1546_27640 [Chloroflexi bacterium]|nr:hypothetical protein [Chloroflexota bacterium]
MKCQVWASAAGGDEGDDQGCDVDTERELGDRQIALDVKVLQAKVAFDPGEVAFDVGTWAHQVSPLADEEQVGQGAFALAAGVVVDIDRSAQHRE